MPLTRRGTDDQNVKERKAAGPKRRFLSFPVLLDIDA